LKRLVNFSEYQIELVTKNKFDMLIDEKIDIFEDDNIWLKSDKEQKNVWRKQTKNDLLLLKISDSPPEDASKNLIKRYKNRIKRISQQKEEDLFSLIINVLSKEFDPTHLTCHPDRPRISIWI
jgi:carboxyl-terminal processing protease